MTVPRRCFELLVPLLVTATGCGDDAAPPAGTDAGTTPGTDGLLIDAAPGPPPEVGTCVAQVTLVGLGDEPGDATLGPLLLDEAGTTICLTLDATANLRIAHFAASSDREDAASSTFQLFLFDAGGALLRAGWDVAFGSSPTRVFASLEYGVTSGSVLDARLVARTRTGTKESSLHVALFEPFE